LRDDTIVPLICPTCQNFRRISQSIQASAPCYFAWGCFRYFSWKREPRRPLRVESVACRAVARGPRSPPSPDGLRRGSLPRFASEGWWARQDPNLQPDRYERRTLSGNPSKISVSRSRSFAFVRVCSRGFWRITGGMETRRGSRLDGSAFRTSSRYRAKADSARTSHFGSDWPN
jgi:hypothetical protein